MSNDYLLRIKNRQDQKISKEEALECLKILDSRNSSVTLTLWGRIIGFFPKTDIRIEKPEVTTDNSIYTSENSQRFYKLKLQREKWTNEKLAVMSPEKKEYFRQMAIARFWDWYERSKLSLSEGFDKYIDGYVRVLIRWKLWYQDEENRYNTEHFSDWDRMVERPDMLPN